MNDAPKFAPSIEDYVNAFTSIESKMTDNQRRMLTGHYQQRGYIATAGIIAKLGGYSDYETANAQYGRLSSLAADTMGIGFRGASMLVLMVPAGEVTNDEWLWILRTHVATALEELGWVKKTSHLFYAQAERE